MSLLRLAQRMKGVSSSPTVRLNALAQEMIRAGKDVVNLTAGEMDFETPDRIKQAAIKALAAGGSFRLTKPVARANEVLVMVLLHNLTCVCHAIVELGIEIDLAPKLAAAKL